MTFARIFTTSVFLAGGLLLACSGGGGSTGGGGGGGGTASGFVDEYCKYIGQCCGQSGYPSDGATCRALAGSSAAQRQYNAAKGEECLAAIRSQAASNPNFCTAGNSVPACSQVYTSAGGAAPGATCESDNDCAPSSEGEVDCVSTFTNGATTRTCQVRVRGKEGDACTGTKDGNTLVSVGSSDRDGGAPSKAAYCDTADGIYCNTSKDVCMRIADVGGACGDAGFDTNACVKNAYCDSKQKTCVARLAAGADCADFSLRSACVADHYCDDTTKKCTASLADDAPCQKSEQCKSRSCTNNKCRESGLSQLGLTLICGPKTGG